MVCSKFGIVSFGQLEFFYQLQVLKRGGGHTVGFGMENHWKHVEYFVEDISIIFRQF